MDTKRPPALTSPWKIGFLVSLLLIFLSIGVNYLIFRTFNLSWSSVGFKEGSWFFHREEFVRELLPLVALIAVASLVAYFAITSAVRKYKAFLDSGHDYRRLISAIKKSDDLDGENFARRLGKYPELRKFLTSVRDQIHRREKELTEWENKLKKRAGDEGLNEKFEKECRTLAEAAQDLVRGEVHEDLHITSPGLASVEEKLRSLSEEGHGHHEDSGREQYADIIDEFRQAGVDLRNRIRESSAELEASCQAARELEEQLSEFSASFRNAAGPLPGTANNLDTEMLTQALQVMQQLCEELGEAGEESKSVAINTALRAGAGEAAVDDMLQLAEDVRKVALKFIDLSQSFGNATDRMRTGMDRIESESNRLQQLSAANSELAPSIGALKNKMSLWVERIIVLNDHLKNAEEIIDLSLAPIDEKLSALAGAAVRDQEDDKAGESGLGDERYEDKITDEIPDNDFELETVDSCAFGADSPIAFEVQDPGAEVQDIPGLEKNPERIFSQRDEADGVHDGHPEEQIRVEPAPALDTDAAFEELPTKGEDMQDKPAAEAGLDVDNREQTDADRLDVASENQNHQAPMQRDKGYTAEKLEGQVAFDLTGDPTAGDGDFIGSFDALDETTGLMDESVSAEELSASPGTSDDDAVHEDADEDEKVIDLYSLGAVDIG